MAFAKKVTRTINDAQRNMAVSVSIALLPAFLSFAGIFLVQ